MFLRMNSYCYTLIQVCAAFLSYGKVDNYARYSNLRYDAMIEGVNFLHDNNYVRSGNTIYQRVVSIHMGTNRYPRPLITDFFL